MARFKVDENLPVEVAELLFDDGHDATTVYEQQLSGQSDAVVLERCKLEDRALVTLDMGFADVRTYEPIQYGGIVVLRLAKQDKSRALRTIRRALPAFRQETIVGKLWIVDESRIRVRST